MVPFRASTTRWHSFQTFTRQSLQYRHSARFFYTRFCLDGNYKSLFQLLSFHPFSIFFPSTCTSYQLHSPTKQSKSHYNTNYHPKIRHTSIQQHINMPNVASVKQFIEAIGIPKPKPKPAETVIGSMSENESRASIELMEIPRAYLVEDEKDPFGYELSRVYAVG